MKDLGCLSPDELDLASQMREEVLWSGIARLSIRGIDVFLPARIFGTVKVEEVGFAAGRVVLFDGPIERELTDFFSLDELEAITEGRGDSDQADATRLHRKAAGRGRASRRAHGAL